MKVISTPFTMVVVGCSQVGKSHWIASFIKNRAHLIDGRPIKNIIWCCKNRDFTPKNLDNEVIIFEGLPNIHDVDPDTLLIIDDMQLDSDKQKDLASLFCIKSHHGHISVILVLQNLFAKMSHSRDLHLNSKYLVIFKNIRDQLSFSYLARQLAPKNTKELESIYKEATSPMYGYLVLDFNPHKTDLLRYYTNIFNPNFCECFVLSENVPEIKTYQKMQTNLDSLN